MCKNQISGGDGLREGQRRAEGGESRAWGRKVKTVNSSLEAEGSGFVL